MILYIPDIIIPISPLGMHFPRSGVCFNKVSFNNLTSLFYKVVFTLYAHQKTFCLKMPIVFSKMQS
jgi:hypothetical protein